MDFSRFLYIFIDFTAFHRFLKIFIDFHRFQGMGAEGLMIRPASPVETFARFQAGFLSSEDFHGIF